MPNLTPQALTTLLTGQHVRLWPYVSGGFARDMLYRVWQAIEAERGWPRLFWWQAVPDAQKGDLAAFAAYLIEDKVPLLVQARATGDLVGLVWFSDSLRDLRTNGSIWYARTAWGAPAAEATRLATAYAHAALGFPQVWGVTPWKAALAHVQRCGFRHVATLPRYVRIHGTPMPLYYSLHEEAPDARPL